MLLLLTPNSESELMLPPASAHAPACRRLNIMLAHAGCGAGQITRLCSAWPLAGGRRGAGLAPTALGEGSAQL